MAWPPPYKFCEVTEVLQKRFGGVIPQIFNRFRRLFLVEPNLRNHLVNLRNQTPKAILQKSSYWIPGKQPWGAF